MLIPSSDISLSSIVDCLSHIDSTIHEKLAKNSLPECLTVIADSINICNESSLSVEEFSYCVKYIEKLISILNEYLCLDSFLWADRIFELYVSSMHNYCVLSRVYIQGCVLAAIFHWLLEKPELFKELIATFANEKLEGNEESLLDNNSSERLNNAESVVLDNKHKLILYYLDHYNKCMSQIQSPHISLYLRMFMTEKFTIKFNDMNPQLKAEVMYDYLLDNIATCLKQLVRLEYYSLNENLGGIRRINHVWLLESITRIFIGNCKSIRQWNNRYLPALLQLIKQSKNLKSIEFIAMRIVEFSEFFQLLFSVIQLLEVLPSACLHNDFFEKLTVRLLEKQEIMDETLASDEETKQAELIACGCLELFRYIEENLGKLAAYIEQFVKDPSNPHQIINNWGYYLRFLEFCSKRGYNTLNALTKLLFTFCCSFEELIEHYNLTAIFRNNNADDDQEIEDKPATMDEVNAVWNEIQEKNARSEIVNSLANMCKNTSSKFGRKEKNIAELIDRIFQFIYKPESEGRIIGAIIEGIVENNIVADVSILFEVISLHIQPAQLEKLSLLINSCHNLPLREQQRMFYLFSSMQEISRFQKFDLCSVYYDLVTAWIKLIERNVEKIEFNSLENKSQKEEDKGFEIKHDNTSDNQESDFTEVSIAQNQNECSDNAAFKNPVNDGYDSSGDEEMPKQTDNKLTSLATNSTRNLSDNGSRDSEAYLTEAEVQQIIKECSKLIILIEDTCLSKSINSCIYVAKVAMRYNYENIVKTFLSRAIYNFEARFLTVSEEIDIIKGFLDLFTSNDVKVPREDFLNYLSRIYHKCKSLLNDEDKCFFIVKCALLLWKNNFTEEVGQCFAQCRMILAESYFPKEKLKDKLRELFVEANYLKTDYELKKMFDVN